MRPEWCHPEATAFLPAGRGISRSTQHASGRSFAPPEGRLRSGRRLVEPRSGGRMQPTAQAVVRRHFVDKPGTGEGLVLRHIWRCVESAFVRLKRFFRPFGACPIRAEHPQLALWAVLFRHYAAASIAARGAWRLNLSGRQESANEPKGNMCSRRTGPTQSKTRDQTEGK